MSAMINAMRVLTDPADTGAVTICIPQDVQGESYDYPESFFQKRVHRIERRKPSEESIKQAAVSYTHLDVYKRQLHLLGFLHLSPP